MESNRFETGGERAPLVVPEAYSHVYGGNALTPEQEAEDAEMLEVLSSVFTQEEFEEALATIDEMWGWTEDQVRARVDECSFDGTMIDSFFADDATAEDEARVLAYLGTLPVTARATFIGFSDFVANDRIGG